MKHEYLEAMGITRWERRGVVASSLDAISTPCHAPSAEWDTLRDRVAQCTACPLHQTRKQTVFGVGNREARLLLIGEAPGATEDQLGEPFVGRAGKLLDAMLHAIGHDRTTVYIANILKCRPPNNRDPQVKEVETCTPFLAKQIEFLKPDIIVALGRIAAHHLLKTDISLSKLRGKMLAHPDTNIPLWVTYHPAYLLRTPADKAKAWQDWQQISVFLNASCAPLHS